MAIAKAGFVLELSLILLQAPDTASADSITPLLFSKREDFLHVFKKKKKTYFKDFNHSRSLASLSCPVLGGGFLLLQPSAVVILSHQPQS